MNQHKKFAAATCIDYKCAPFHEINNSETSKAYKFYLLSMFGFPCLQSQNDQPKYVSKQTNQVLKPASTFLQGLSYMVNVFNLKAFLSVYCRWYMFRNMQVNIKIEKIFLYFKYYFVKKLKRGISAYLGFHANTYNKNIFYH